MPDLCALVGQDTRLRRAAGTNGGEWAGACPLCGDGTDRFRVWPTEGRWWCRRCGRHGDAIQYLRERDGLSFRDAVEALGGSVEALRSRPVTPAPAQEDAEPPGPEWQARARQFLAWAQERLWEPAGAEALRYLREERGLRDETIRAAGLGFAPREVRDLAHRWDLTDEEVWIPTGIVIPCQADGAIWYAKIRRPDRAEPKYITIRGSRARALFNADSLPGPGVAFVCEGEFDALLLAQEVGSLAAVVGLPSATTRLSLRFRWKFVARARIVSVLDADEAGQEGARKLAEALPGIRTEWPPMGSKDVTVAWHAGVDLADWAASVIGGRR